jgi:hypothetical protein
MKLDIVKNTWISEITADFFREGYWGCAYGLEINFTGNALPTTDIIAQIIEPLTKLTLPKRKIVRLRGFFHPTDPMMAVLIRSFKSWGFMVQAVIDPNAQTYSWQDIIDWLILRIDKPFSPYVANELWYVPAPSEVIAEPVIPPKETLLYLAKGYSTAATVRFITGSDRNWNLL